MPDKPFIAKGFFGKRPAAPPGRLPPGQYEERGFPVLSAGPTPRVDLKTWDFTVRGIDGAEARWTWEELRALPHETPTVDIHCVTKWSNTPCKGVSVDTLLENLEAEARVRHRVLRRARGAGVAGARRGSACGVALGGARAGAVSF